MCSQFIINQTVGLKYLQNSYQSRKRYFFSCKPLIVPMEPVINIKKKTFYYDIDVPTNIRKNKEMYLLELKYKI